MGSATTVRAPPWTTVNRKCTLTYCVPFVVPSMWMRWYFGAPGSSRMPKSAVARPATIGSSAVHSAGPAFVSRLPGLSSNFTSSCHTPCDGSNHPSVTVVTTGSSGRSGVDGGGVVSVIGISGGGVSSATRAWLSYSDRNRSKVLCVSGPMSPESTPFFSVRRAPLSSSSAALASSRAWSGSSCAALAASLASFRPRRNRARVSSYQLSPSGSAGVVSASASPHGQPPAASS